MKYVNLIPAHRLVARQRRRHVRRCVVGCAAWAVASTCVAVGALTLGRPATGDLDTRLGRTTKEAEVAVVSLSAARADLASANSTLRATRAVADQPDWSALFALLGRSVGEDVVLRSVELRPETPAPSQPAAAPAAAAAKAGSKVAKVTPAPALILNVGGLGRSQLAVTRFILRLESTGLFARVTLLDTGREPFHTGEATSFRAVCLLDPSVPAAAPPGGSVAGGGADATREALR